MYNVVNVDSLKVTIVFKINITNPYLDSRAFTYSLNNAFVENVNT